MAGLVMTAPDIEAWLHASYVSIVPRTDLGVEWCDEHIFAEPLMGAYHAEHRYGPDILLAAHNAGLSVEIDGRLADAPREH